MGTTGVQWYDLNGNVYPVTDAAGLQYAVIVLGVFCAVFFVGFIVALIYIVCTRRKPQGYDKC